MLRQGLVALSLLLEQDEGVSRGPAVWLLDEENSELLVQNLARLLAAIEEVNLTRNSLVCLLSALVRVSPLVWPSSRTAVLSFV